MMSSRRMKTTQKNRNSNHFGMFSFEVSQIRSTDSGYIAVMIDVCVCVHAFFRIKLYSYSATTMRSDIQVNVTTYVRFLNFTQHFKRRKLNLLFSEYNGMHTLFLSLRIIFCSRWNAHACLSMYTVCTFTVYSHHSHSCFHLVVDKKIYVYMPRRRFLEILS